MSETKTSGTSDSFAELAAQQTASTSSTRGDIRANLLIVNDTNEPLVDENGTPIVIEE